MSQIISRQVKGRNLRVIIDLSPGEALVVVKTDELPLIRRSDDRHLHFIELVAQPAK